MECRWQFSCITQIDSNPVLFISDAASLMKHKDKTFRQKDETKSSKVEATNTSSSSQLDVNSLLKWLTGDKVPKKDFSHDIINLKELKAKLLHVWSSLDESLAVDGSLFASLIIMETLKLCSDHLKEDSLNEIMLACISMRKYLTKNPIETNNNKMMHMYRISKTC